MYCKNCGEQMNENQAICIKCGAKAGGGNKYCSNCGKEMPENADVCTNCGVAVKKQFSVSLDGDLGGQSKLTMALICFFFGGLGVHNFMMGETKKGMFKIIMFFCGFIVSGILALIIFKFRMFYCGFIVSGILALIDFIKILTDKYVIEPDKLI